MLLLSIHSFIYQYVMKPYYVQGIGNSAANRKDSSSQPGGEDNLKLLMTIYGVGRSEVYGALVVHGHDIKTCSEYEKRPFGKTKIKIEM